MQLRIEPHSTLAYSAGCNKTLAVASLNDSWAIYRSNKRSDGLTATNARENSFATAPCLVLLCKRPAPGHSKQRLAAQIGAGPALQIAGLLLDCALEDLQQWPAARVIAPDHVQHLAWAQALCPQATVLGQSAGNLGQRLNALDQQLRQLGHRQLLFIGSDAPVLQQTDFERVTALLDSTDTVLLAAKDGGVVLMASNRPWPELSQLPWSTPLLGQALAECCRAAGHSVQLTGEYFDIDHREDLLLLESALQADSRPARINLRKSLTTLGVVLHG